MVVIVGSLRVVRGAPPVDDDDRLVADDPGVVPGRQRGHLPRHRVELVAVVGADPQRAGQVVLEVRRLAPVGAGDRLDVDGPAPTRLKGEPADLGPGDPDEVEPSVGELAGLAGAPEVLPLVGGVRGVSWCAWCPPVVVER